MNMYGYDWEVIRTTTDKLQEELNDLAWDVYQIQYTGGRDWVIIIRDEGAGVPPEPEVPLAEEDLEFTPVRAPGQPAHENPRGVKVTYKPTGLTVTADEGKSQLENKARVLEVLRDWLG